MEKFLRKGFGHWPCRMGCVAAGAGGGGCLGGRSGIARECLAAAPSQPALFPAPWRPSRHPGSAGMNARR